MLNDITVDIAQWECNNNKSYASAFRYNQLISRAMRGAI